MTLETVDIQEVFALKAEGKLALIKTDPVKIDWLEREVQRLEHYQGNLLGFRLDSSAADLFKIERALAFPESKELKKRWDAAIKLSTKIRLQLLRCKALNMLEDFNDETKAPINTFCKTMLSDVLVEGTERAKSKFAYLRTPGNDTRSISDEINELEEGEE